MKRTKSVSEGKPKKLGIILLSSGIALLLAVAVAFNILALVVFDNILTQALGSGEPGTVGETHGADTEYYKSAFKNAKELSDYEMALCAEMAQEGATVLKNDGLLPLAEGTQLDLYGHGSVDLVSGGSGSGSGSFELTLDLRTGLTDAGFKVNDALWNFYQSGAGSAYKRGTGVINYGRGFDWNINECPVSVLKEDKSVMDSIDRKNIAVFVISRTGGEGGDEPRDMKEFGGERGQHYLELDQNEKDTLRFLGENYDNVIVLVNSNNAFELGFVNETSAYPNIKAVINFPGAGRSGTRGLGYMLKGKDADGNEISASGHLVDTFVYDNFSSPAMQNFGDAAFTDAEGRVIMYWGKDVMYSNGQYGGGADNINEDAGRCPFYFVTYNEGIYVGYKYYETRYEDYVLDPTSAGDYDYASTVTYPFGYGQSYTDFVWSNFEASPKDADGNITITLDVKNDGDRAGKDVVQLYYQSPYTEYDRSNHIEKSAVNLIGFKKTENIEPGETKPVEITVNVNDFASYDDAAGGYLLEADQTPYYITAAPDAHTAVNNILKKKLAGNGEALGRIVETSALTGDADARESSVDFVAEHTQSEEVRDESVQNLFDDANLIDRSEYLTRKNWQMMDDDGLRYATLEDQAVVNCPGVGKNPWGNTHVATCAELNGKQFRAVIPDGLLEKLTSSDSLIPEEKKESNADMPVLGQDHDIDLIDLRGLPYESELWDQLLEQVTIDELSLMVAQCGYVSPQMKSINKPKAVDLDGPAGLNKVVGHGSVEIGKDLYSMTWATEYMLASTWNDDFALKMGECVGEDGLYAGVHGWYGPAVNIHRTPFSGRNFEYYSEDPYISGIMGKMAVRGAATKGMYAFIKHFAVNDQETHRDQNGLITFLNEQSLREIYLKPFELSIKENDIQIFYNEAIKAENGDITGYEKKEATIPAATAIMSSFNRIGATWAGGNYKLITQVLREEFGFKGFVLTDYDTGNYMQNNTKQMLEAGGDAKLNTIGQWNGLRSGSDRNENIRYALNAAKNVLYTVVHSSAMNGFVHGVEYVEGFANYKFIVIGFDVLAIGGMLVMAFFLVKKTMALVKYNRAQKK